MKGWMGFTIMALIAVMLFALILIFQEVPLVRHLLAIKKTVDIFVSINDEGAKVVSFLRTRMPGMDMTEIISLSACGLQADDKPIEYALKEIGIIKLKIYQRPGGSGKEKVKTFGGLASGAEYQIDVPLPGGSTGKIGIFLEEV